MLGWHEIEARVEGRRRHFGDFLLSKADPDSDDALALARAAR
jgi:hypothetical protein